MTVMAALVGAVDAPDRGLPHAGLRRPRRARSFFEALVADNLDVGRPDSVELTFTGPRRTGRRATLGCFPKTKVVTRDTEVTMNAFFKHSRVKQYLKDGRALRIEMVGQLTHRPALPAPAGAPG